MWQIKPPALISPAPISPFSLPAPANGEVCIHLPPNRIILLCNWFICSEGRWQCFGNESLGNRRPRIQPTPCVNFITSVQMNLKGRLCARSLAVCVSLKGSRFNGGHWCVCAFPFLPFPRRSLRVYSACCVSVAVCWRPCCDASLISFLVGSMWHRWSMLTSGSVHTWIEVQQWWCDRKTGESRSINNSLWKSWNPVSRGQTWRLKDGAVKNIFICPGRVLLQMIY